MPKKPAGPFPAATFHPRNRHQGRYDFGALVAACPALAEFVTPNAYGDASIDFADPKAVRALNGALLKLQYGIAGWTIPAAYLCPPIPGRADYIHCLADLLAGNGPIPRGESVRVLDVGVGANCIYPLIGHAEYGWRIVGSDIDRGALTSAQAILDANPGFPQAIELRHQTAANRLFQSVIRPGEYFDASLCNPPFHASAREASAGTERKWRNLGKDAPGAKTPALNFGGQSRELWCEGGEEAFLSRMIEESVQFRRQCRWFTALVSKATTLPALKRVQGRVGVTDGRTLDMAQGQKKSRVLAWTFA